MRVPVQEEVITPVHIDRSQELNSYYISVESFLTPGAQTHNPYPQAPVPPGGVNEWGQPQPPNTSLGGYNYPPQPGPYGGYPSNPSPQTGYPPPMPQQQGYAPYSDPNVGYPYQQNLGYPAPQPGMYGQPVQYSGAPGYPPYQGYGQSAPPMPGTWPGYGAGYDPNYPAAAPPHGQYQQPGYPPYTGYPPPNQGQAGTFYPPEQPVYSQTQEGGQGAMDFTEMGSPRPENPGKRKINEIGWNEALFHDEYDPSYAPSTSSPWNYDGMDMVEETVTTSQSTTGYQTTDYYFKQFEQLHIGWN